MRPSALLDLVFPPRCGGCGRAGTPWCVSCAASIRPAHTTRLGDVPLVAAACLQGPFQQAIHAYKYRPRPVLSAELAAPLVVAVKDAGLPLRALTFVPLHPGRARERGFNQAERLARELGVALGLPVVPGLARTRPTAAQVGLTGPEREANVAGAFRWAGAEPAPLAAGLVDDVCTTGATLQAAAEGLISAGGSVAAFLVLAVAHTSAAPLVTLPE
ncbi:MAG: ComF family protein [Candidatus Dormibacteraeota bacterium]|nr:ComF family protein [Candidatus Dormibacteraeota bacterium]